MENPFEETPQAQPTTTKTPAPPTTATRNNPRLVKEGFKSYQGTTKDERAMLVNAIQTMLANEKDQMTKYVGRQTAKTRQQKVQSQDTTVEELRVILTQTVKPKYVKIDDDPPHRMKYHTDFLLRFDDAQEYGRYRQNSQENQISDTIEIVFTAEDDDDDSTVLPPAIIKTTTNTATSDIHITKRPRGVDDFQTTLTQHWTPNRYEKQVEEMEDMNKKPSAKDIVATPKITYNNPYKKQQTTATPMVTPHKTNTHTKLKTGTQETQANLKTPPI